MSADLAVGIAGATGYAGQELLRLAARHPAVRVAAAMGSGSAEGVRRLPALARIWDGEVTPLSPVRSRQNFVRSRPFNEAAA